MRHSKETRVATWVQHLPSEKNLQAKILRDLESRAIFNFKVITANKRGIPDIICCINGKFVAFEIKRLTGLKNSPNYKHSQVSSAQKIKGSEIAAAGGLMLFIDSFGSYLLALKSLGLEVENG